MLVPSFVGHLDAGDRSGAEHLAGELLGVTLVVLGVNLLGDGLRDTLDPRLRRSARNL